MANYSTLKAAVADVVKTNGEQAITGANLQAVLLSIINSIGGGGYIFKGVATPSTSAGTPDENVFYIGSAGEYSNFGATIEIPMGSIGVFKYNGSWICEQITTGYDDVMGAVTAIDDKTDGFIDNFEVSNNIEYIPFTLGKGIQFVDIGATASLEMTDHTGWGCAVVHLQAGEEMMAAFYSSSYYGFMVVDSNNVCIYKNQSTGNWKIRYKAESEVNVVVNNQNTNNGFVSRGVLHDIIVNRSNTEGDLNKVVGCESIPFYYGQCYTEAVCGKVVGTFGTGAYSIVPCVIGDKFTIKLYSGSAGILRTYAFYDSTNNRISYGNSTNGIITAPENSAYVVFNHNFGLDAEYYAFKGEIGDSILDSFNGVSAQLNEISNAIGHDDEDVPNTTVSDSYWNSEGTVAVATSHANYSRSEPIEIEHGKVYRVTIYKPSTEKYSAVAIVDDNYNILKTYNGTNAGYNNIIIEPQDTTSARYILLSSLSTRTWTITVDALNYLGDFAKLNAGKYDFTGKNVAIIGDSISTNGNWSVSNPLGNVPEIIVQSEDVGVQLQAYVTEFDVGTILGGHQIVAEDVGNELTFTPTADDIGKVIGRPRNYNSSNLTVWWEIASNILGFNPIPVAWSGSSITSHEENKYQDGGYIYKTSYAWHDAQIRKCGIRTAGSMDRTAPDMVIIYRGTNDMSHSPEAIITDYFENIPDNLPTTDVISDGGETYYGYIEGLIVTINKLRAAYPDTRIVLCTLNYFKRSDSTYKSRFMYNRAIREVANYMNTSLIEFDKDGINAANGDSTYYDDAPNYTHPNDAGHKVLANRAIIDLFDVNSME